ncbi:MAG: cryptochrome/photolyase family protein [Verrucomicrobiota bacterium]
MQTVWILADQLVPDHPALAEANKKDTVVLFVESRRRASHLQYHQQKLVLLYSAMRHRAAELREAGWTVDYHRLEDTKAFSDGLKAHVKKHRPERILVMEPNDYATTKALPPLAKSAGVEIETVPTNMFLVPRAEFAEWAEGKKSLVMESHYRRMRKELGLLVDADGKPVGGEWNFDAENRKTEAQYRKAKVEPPPLAGKQSDETTEEVIEAVQRHFGDHPGRAEGFWLPVHRAGAQRWLRRFVCDRLEGFGPWEDTMVQDEPHLFHSVLSPLLNIGLLTPKECVDAAVRAFDEGDAPLASVEGFVRQIIGWREFINGIYWLRMPGYTELNELEAKRPLPEWAWGREGEETEMNCLRQCVRQVRDTGYNHHIQRLMVLGNYFLLSGTAPREVLDWFNSMYVDAYDWVMAANVIGMVLYADGGFMATKPYAAGSGYISKMSDYCKDCRYKPSVKTGDDACPFNYLYWNFYAEHAERFAGNQRVAFMVRQWEKKSPSEQKSIRAQAQAFLS